MVDSFWVPLSVQLVEKSADDFLCNHLLCLKSHYLHANAFRGKTLILWAPFEMKIGNVLGMVRKKEKGKKGKKKENSFAKQISLKKSFVHYTDGSCDVWRMARRFAPLKHKKGCLVCLGQAWTCQDSSNITQRSFVGNHDVMNTSEQTAIFLVTNSEHWIVNLMVGETAHREPDGNLGRAERVGLSSGDTVPLGSWFSGSH